MKYDAAPPEQALYHPEDLGPGRTTRLEGNEADHGKKSLRLRTGDTVHLVNGRGRRYRGRVVGLGKQFIDVAIDSEETLPSWPEITLWLGAGVLRSTRMDTLVEKASELGVSRFVPLVLERSVAKPVGEGTKEDRWHRLAIESLKQSRRARLMEIDLPQNLEAFVNGLPSGSELWVADPEGEPPLRTPATMFPALGLVVGPEGGLSERERRFLAGKQARFIALGRNRLRAETAAIALVTAAILLGEDRPSARSG